MDYKEKFDIAFKCGIASFLLGEDQIEKPKIDLSIEHNNAKNEFEFWYFTVFLNGFIAAKLAKQSIDRNR